jgi:deoxyribodipyrimidine photo-lyase
MPDTMDTLRTRLKKLGSAVAPQDARSVLYIMSRDCRVQTNHALLAAQQHALKEKLPLVVAFVVYDRQLGNRAQEHIAFLLRGLKDIADSLESLQISFVIRSGEQLAIWEAIAADTKPAAIYFDFSPLRSAVQSKESFAHTATIPVFVVDTHNVVPAWVASGKQEIGARTLRPKIHHFLPEYLQDSIKLQKHPHRYNASLKTENLDVVIKKVTQLYPSNGTDVSRFLPGETAAQQALKIFIRKRLRGYASDRNDPTKNNVSELSPYLHFGQLSSLQVAIAVYDQVKQDSSLQSDANTLVEEMIVRKELADNYCYYNGKYDSLEGAPEWAQRTLAKHAADPREFIYTLEQFKNAETHDEAWNAAQLQLTRTGKIHGYMRMYWAKKVLEWSKTPDEALTTLLYLNDFYHLDGGDPNGYVGILWSVAGLHDRPWGERPVYGVIRSMVYGGLKRKFNIQAYIEKYN